MNATIREAAESDAGQILDIYSYYVLHEIATFVEVPPTIEEMAEKIAAVKSKGFPFLVAESGIDGRILGYAYASNWIQRSAYKRTAEGSVYVRNGCGGNGIGFKLTAERDKRLREDGFRTVLGGIALPNEASVKLHEKLGYKQVGTLHDVGLKFGKWIDVGYWQVIFE